MNPMGALNVFETIRKAQPTRTEPFHSQFIADALAQSLEAGQDRSLFDEVWRLIAPTKWCIPDNARVEAEVVVDSGRVDVCVRDDSRRRIVGIEVKTEDASAEYGQLEKYRFGLEKRYQGWGVAIAYLTPFNRERAKDKADSLHAVRVFNEFSQEIPNARHVSWIDVADICWDDNELWRQHQAYVREYISSYEKLSKRTLRSRGFDHFFGEAQADEFWDALHILGIEPDTNGATIEIARFNDCPLFAEKLVCAFETLIRHGNGISRHLKRDDKFSEGARRRFLESPYRGVHLALFDLSHRIPYVWVKGKSNYGIRVAHRTYPSGVSLVTSGDEGRLHKIGVLRRASER